MSGPGEPNWAALQNAADAADEYAAAQAEEDEGPVLPAFDRPVSPQELVEAIGQVPSMAYYGMVSTEHDYSEVLRTEVWRVQIATGGYSVNEQLTGELTETLFHLAFWASTHRGGLFVYEVPAAAWETPMPVHYGQVPQ